MTREISEPSDPERRVAVVEGFFRALSAGNLEECLQAFHPDSEIVEPDSLPYAGRYRGREGVEQLVAAVMGIYEFEIGAADIRAAGDGAVGILEASFVARTTGRRLDTRVVEIYGFSDGLISSVDVFPQDTHAICQLTDVTAPSPAASGAVLDQSGS